MLQVDLENIVSDVDVAGRLQEILQKVENEGRTVVILHNGRPAVVVSPAPAEVTTSGQASFAPATPLPTAEPDLPPLPPLPPLTGDAALNSPAASFPPPPVAPPPPIAPVPPLPPLGSMPPTVGGAAPTAAPPPPIPPTFKSEGLPTPEKPLDPSNNSPLAG